jgi:predicted phosphodiesterase
VTSPRDPGHQRSRRRRRLATALFAAVALAGAGAPAASAVAPDRVALNPAATPATAQTFTWRAPDGAAGGVELRVPGGAVREIPSSGGVVLRRARHHAVTMDSLTPDTAYEYRVGGSAGWSAWHGFRTATEGLAKPWRFLSFGDAQEGLDVWGRWMKQPFAAVPDARLVMHVGDLVNAPNEDPEWAQWFGGQAGTVESRNVFAVPGNHEYLGTKSSFPFVDSDSSAQTFRAHFEHPRNGVEGLEDTNYTFEYQGVRFVALNTGDNGLNDPSPQQREWLDRTLTENRARWTVVMFHIPMWSSADQHHDQAARVRRSWLDVIERHDVDLVMQGHTHAYGRGHVNGRPNGPQYVVSTSGPKYYELGTPGEDWTSNGATPKLIVGETSTSQTVCVGPDTLAVRSTIIGKGEASTTTEPVGATLDEFTVRKGSGAKRVTDTYDCAADAPAPTPPPAPAPEPPAPGAPAAQPDPPLAQCAAKATAVTDVAAGRTRDVVHGEVPVAHAGARAALQRREGRRWKTVGRAKVAATGAVRFRVAAPGAAVRRAARYRVVLPGVRAVSAARTQRARVATVKRAGLRVRVSGRVAAPRRAAVRIGVRRPCGPWRVVRTVRAGSGGRFSATVAAPAGATVRVETRVRRAGRTVTLRSLGRTVG